MNRQKWRMALVLAASLLGIAGRADAQVVLHDGNSTAFLDPFTQRGMYHWDVLGQNQLQQQWFWFGIGAGPVASVDTIGVPSIVPLGANEVRTTYATPTFSVGITYLLTGGTPVPPGVAAVADIAETIRIVNHSASVLPFHFYQYSYFNLNGAGSDTVQLGVNVNGRFNSAYQTSGSQTLSETVITPGAPFGEVAPLGNTLSKLNSGGPVVLGPPFFSGPVGPGAVTWALQWDFNIAPGATAIISKDKYLEVVIPEPSILALAGVGLLALSLSNRRKAK